ncbi:hypothetical protein [Natrinema gelatinilyticum]|uniref:hypothetical protein n=1 Tax=Natrinema gelatinilyticum TaxID=2961571 RepID=UPI0020C242AD|nr:hypothetical protein [Natrinema gelatinilyticum]
MSQDDLRGLESPDRPRASNTNARAITDGGERTEPESESATSPNESPIPKRLETISKLVRGVLADVRRTDEPDAVDHIDEWTRRRVTRKLRAIDAETRRVELELIVLRSPTGDDSSGDSDGDIPAVTSGGSGTTSHLGPDLAVYQLVKGDDGSEATTSAGNCDADEHDGGDRDGE